MTIKADRLRELRLSRHVMSKQMAELLNITPRNYQRYEKGEVDPPTSKTIFLADYFGVTLDYITGRADEPHGLFGFSDEEAAAIEQAAM